MKPRELFFNLTLVFFVLLIALCDGSKEILGCGGFIQSQIDIDFSQVIVKLYTKQGSLKDQTECAPNGYYFLPLYDKGEYVLKIHPPEGWSFEPKTVNLNIDGHSDPCTQSKDINFEFKGFAITGKVLSSGSAQGGPAGVTLYLHLSQDENSPYIQETVSQEGGFYLFTPVHAGRYWVRASHPIWKLEKDVVQVKLTNGNAQAHDLFVTGYDVSAHVTNDDSPIEGVNLLLFSHKTAGPMPKVTGCSVTPLHGYAPSSPPPLCHSMSDSNGLVKFTSVPPGRYFLVPHYQARDISIQFDVQPPRLEFELGHGSLDLDTEFQVKGFTISGSVVNQPGSIGKGIPEVEVWVDGQLAGKTNHEGVYILENIQSKQYRLSFVAQNYQFAEARVHISPTNPKVPAVHPTAFRACGRILPWAESQPQIRTVTIKDVPNGNLVVEVETQDNGEFCAFLDPGKYYLSAIVTEEEKSNGLQYYPLKHSLEITTFPILSGLEFAQLKVSLKGSVVCTKPEFCTKLLIRLSDPMGESTIQTQVVSSGKYAFRDIVPGRYRLTIDKSDWCWETIHQIVTVGTQPETEATSFVQTGFYVDFVSSHETQVQYRLIGVSDSPKRMLNLRQGTSRICLTELGPFEFRPEGCHGYASPVQQWMPPSVVTFTAISHSVSGQVVSRERVNDIYINVINNEDGKLKIKLGPLKSESGSDGQIRYPFSLQVKPGEALSFEPSASVLLFEPTQASLVGADDCQINVVRFRAERGRIIEGRIEPPLPGVKVTITNKHSDNIIVATETSDGTFKIGPLQSTLEYKVTAEKDGYSISEPNEDGVLRASILAEIKVNVRENDAVAAPIPGVLLSLSGEQGFRQNSQTGTNGTFHFTSLRPGEYFLRPMMKEYRFEPTSKKIQVSEDILVSAYNVELIGRRVAYSAYGTVTSLNGTPEEGVVIEAVTVEGSRGPCEALQEETTTEAHGQFRIRGLQPKCDYIIRLKEGADINKQVERATPSKIPVKTVDGDVRNLRVVVFHRLTHMIVSAFIDGGSPEELRTLRVKLCREDLPDSPIHVSKLDSTTAPTSPKQYPGSTVALVAFPALPIDGRSYFIQLESSLSKTTHSYKTQPVYFRANGTFKQMRLAFRSDPRIIEQELNHSSYYALPVILLAILAVFNHNKVLPFISKIVSSIVNNVPNSQSVRRSSSSNNDSARDDAAIIESILGPQQTSRRKVKPRKT